MEFTIDRKRNVINAQVVKSVSAKLDKEALRIIESMPQWKPGMQRGRPVAVRMSVPIDFVIDQVYKAIDSQVEINRKRLSQEVQSTHLHGIVANIWNG
ncbi:MAG: energy transducer TonB [Bacteroides thetaiotaomicron]